MTTNPGRRANGPQCSRTQQTKARDVAASILGFWARGMTRSIDDYCVKDAAQRALIAQQMIEMAQES